jgi:hypothetical protein
MHEARARRDLLIFDPSNRCFCSFRSYDSFSDPARSTILSFDEIIGFEESSGFHSIEICITACDLEEKSFETVDDIVLHSLP